MLCLVGLRLRFMGCSLSGIRYQVSGIRYQVREQERMNEGVSFGGA